MVILFNCVEIVVVFVIIIIRCEQFYQLCTTLTQILSCYQAVDWDDRMRTVKWVDVAPEEEPFSTARKAPRPAKKKITEVEAEPPFTALENSTKDVELLLSAVCDYAKYRCKVESVHFKDTLMFQSRVYR